MAKEEADFITIILTDEKTGEPIYPEDPIILLKEDYQWIQTQAKENGVTFEEEFIRIIKIGMESLIQDYSHGSRITLEETGGRKRSYSYSLTSVLPLGIFEEEELPDELLGEIEALAQSPEAPDFLREPEGSLKITVTGAKS